ncbi:MAG: galactokinase, partial [Oscillospiraceae bacterium]|nr:galactokinase [Oscillospiraceae bacterium]
MTPIEKINNGQYDSALSDIYGSGDVLSAQKERYLKLSEYFGEIFGADRELRFFSAPGRTEVGGNHTDHNRGRVLAAAVNLDAIAAAAKNDENIVRVKSYEYAKTDVIDIRELDVKESEREKSAALIRGLCAAFASAGYKTGGFDAVTISSVLKGSGLSSSAAFEVLCATVINGLYNGGKVPAVEIAKMAQYAENKYYGKPCGLMDQTASAVGALVAIDFKNPADPVIERVDYEFRNSGHALCIVDTGGSHADLTEDYTSIRAEMESVAAFLGGNALRDADEAEFYKKIPVIREKTGDRAVLRAYHFYTENERALKEAEALKNGD